MQNIKMEIIPMPVIITREDKWFVACCPLLDIATQGITEKEVKENIKDLLVEYMADPDTVKPDIENIISTSIELTSIPVPIKGVNYGRKTSSLASAKGYKNS